MSVVSTPEQRYKNDEFQQVKQTMYDYSTVLLQVFLTVKRWRSASLPPLGPSFCIQQMESSSYIGHLVPVVLGGHCKNSFDVNRNELNLVALF